MLRVLIISAVVPGLTGGGGRLALHRHFVLRKDFEVAVASRWAPESSVPKYFLIRSCRFWHRVKRSIAGRLITNYEYLTAGYWFWLSKPLFLWARAWSPDIVFTVADDWHAPLARAIAKKLGVPLAVDFQDLFAVSTFLSQEQQPYRWLRPLLMRRYKKLQSDAEIVMHVCKGMKEWFGRSQRGQILYSIGGTPESRTSPRPAPTGSIRIVYAGNCYGAYGKLIRQLAEAVLEQSRIELEIYSMGNDWPPTVVDGLVAAGIFRGFLPFDELRPHLEQADMFLTVMSFQAIDRIFVETSFTTKWMDYVPFAQPIMVWGPANSSAARFARETGAGFVVSDQSAENVLSAVIQIADDSAKWVELGNAARRVACTELDPANIHNVLLEALSSPPSS